ncbi:MAG TPA: non-heme iron oxygenase ferredoxin subunit [Acidimicrobiia bacterium]|nr:non-heme iron oxygenase ferredoxin subunit [Acidimicrobiia bacterium]
MRVEVTQLDSLPRDRGVRVSIGEHRIAMFRVGDQVYAIGDRCSHAEASLSEGELWDTSVECPRHGSEFDLKTGEALSLPATKPVPVYDVSVEEGTVYLELEAGE